MPHLPFSRRAAVLAVIGLGASLWTGCSDRSPDALTGPSAQRQFAGDRLQEIHAVLAVHKRHSAALLRLPGVVGTAVGLLPNGKPGLKVLLASPEVRGLPSALEGIPVVAQVTGDRKSTRLNSSHLVISYAVFCLKKKKNAVT